MIETKKEQEYGVVVAVAPKFQTDDKTQEYLDELEFLVQNTRYQSGKGLFPKAGTPRH